MRGDSMDLGMQIRVMRKRQNMTQAHLAQLIGVDQLTIDRWEGCVQCDPTPAQLRALARILDFESEGHQAADQGTPRQAHRLAIWPWRHRAVRHY